MEKEYIYKLQGDGKDSWICIEKDDQGNESTRYMVYEKPTKEVANWKLKAILDTMGLLPQINTAINNLSEPNKTFANYAWEYSPTINMYSPIIKVIQQACNLTWEEVVTIFNEAEAISI